MQRLALVVCATLVGVSTTVPWASVDFAGTVVPARNLFNAHGPWLLIPAAMVAIALGGIWSAMSAAPESVAPTGILVAVAAGGLGWWILLRDHVFASPSGLSPGLLPFGPTVRPYTGAYVGMGAAAVLFLVSLATALVASRRAAGVGGWPPEVTRAGPGAGPPADGEVGGPGDGGCLAGDGSPAGGGVPPSTGRGVFPPPPPAEEPDPPPLPAFLHPPWGPLRGQGGRPARRPPDHLLPAAWHPDPWNEAAQRWWDGQGWTAHTRDGGDLGTR